MISESQINSAVAEMFDGIEFTSEPAGLYDPLRYMIAIGGKRIRPKLCLTAYSLFKEELGAEVIVPATALEVFHTFTLIHDDIMDKSPLRRGCETVWKKWSEVTGILSGDVMLIDSYKRIAAAPEASRSRVMELFSRTAAEVCEGQQYDMEFESRDDVAMPEYEKMIGLKTAVLLACSAQMGALIAGASDKECEALYRYGYDLGMAFQVADDYLDAFGDEKVFGKPIGGDIIQQKKSWLTVHTVEKIAASQDEESGMLLFADAMAMPSETPEERSAKIDAVREIYRALDVDSDARAEIARYSQQAIGAVEGLSLPEERLDMLRKFAERLVGRVN